MWDVGADTTGLPLFTVYITLHRPMFWLSLLRLPVTSSAKGLNVASLPMRMYRSGEELDESAGHAQSGPSEGSRSHEHAQSEATQIHGLRVNQTAEWGLERNAGKAGQSGQMSATVCPWHTPAEAATILARLVSAFRA